MNQLVLARRSAIWRSKVVAYLSLERTAPSHQPQFSYLDSAKKLSKKFSSKVP